MASPYPILLSYCHIRDQSIDLPYKVYYLWLRAAPTPLWIINHRCFKQMIVYRSMIRNLYHLVLVVGVWLLKILKNFEDFRVPPPGEGWTHVTQKFINRFLWANSRVTRMPLYDTLYSGHPHLPRSDGHDTITLILSDDRIRYLWVGWPVYKERPIDQRVDPLANYVIGAWVITSPQYVAYVLSVCMSSPYVVPPCMCSSVCISPLYVHFTLCIIFEPRKKLHVIILW